MDARILFVHNGRTRFVMMDLELLRQEYDVTEVYLSSRRINPVYLFRAVQSHDVVFGWFASWHTFVPMLIARFLGRPSILIIGGYDLANMPEIGYGHQRGGIRKWVSQGTMQMSTYLITNARYSRKEAERNAGIPKERLTVVYHGIPDPFGKLPEKSNERLVLTVGNVDRPNLWRKGHELFVRAASHLPEHNFVLVGAWKDDSIDYLRDIASPNVTFTGWVEDDVLFDYYRRASVYVQVSAHEGFGLSVAEAMLAGCVPVLTRAGALPEVVGDAGLYTEPNADALADTIMKTLDTDQEQRRRARERILREFPLEKRADELTRLIAETI